MTTIEQAPQPSVKIKLDWRAYYLKFKELHGDPVEYAGRLLFPDAWMYSKTDYSGPEWAPPASAKWRHRLQYRYWAKRRLIVTQELVTLKEELLHVTSHQQRCSAPLQQSIVYTTEDDEGRKKMVRATGDVELTGLRERISWLEADIGFCQENMNVINVERVK